MSGEARPSLSGGSTKSERAGRLNPYAYESSSSSSSGGEPTIAPLCLYSPLLFVSVSCGLPSKLRESGDGGCFAWEGAPWSISVVAGVLYAAPRRLFDDTDDRKCDDDDGSREDGVASAVDGVGDGCPSAPTAAPFRLRFELEPDGCCCGRGRRSTTMGSGACFARLNFLASFPNTLRRLIGGLGGGAAVMLAGRGLLLDVASSV